MRHRKSLEVCAGPLVRAVRLVLSTDRRGAVAAVVLQLVGAASALGVVLAGREALSAVLAPSSSGRAHLLLALALLAVMVTLAGSVGAVQAQQQRLLGERVHQRMNGELLRSAAAVDLMTYESSAFLRTLERVRGSALSRPMAVVSALLGLLGSSFGVVVMTATLIAIEPLLVPVLLAAGVPTVLLARRASRAEVGFASRVSPILQRRGYFGMLLTHRFSASEVRAFEVAGPLLDRHDAEDAAYERELRQHARHRMTQALISVGGAGAALALALLAIVALVGAGRITLPDAGAAAIAARLLSGQLTTVFRALAQLVESVPFLTELESFSRTHPPHIEPGRSHALHTGLRLDEVTFTYPGAAAPAVAGASVRLEKGSVVALVGENGSGKTTLAKVLAGLYAPTTGRVQWDGAELAGHDLRASVTVLFQEYVRYQLTVADNVVMLGAGRPVDVAALEVCLGRVGILEAVRALPKGLDTVLGLHLEDGADLSGGQWQRLALARALYRDAPVIVLDEPTASMDPRAEHELFTDVRAVLDGRAALLISHRYSSVRLADYIYVLDAGRVVEEGSHEQLMALGGRYAELYTLQAEAYAS